MAVQLSIDGLPEYSTVELTGPRPDVQARAEIVRLQASGLGPKAIAGSLNARRVPTPTGRGVWWPSTVQRHVHPDRWAAYMRRRRGQLR